MIDNEHRFHQLIEDALAQDFSGWDFSYLQGRWSEDNLQWDYAQIVKSRLSGVRTLLDMGTGGGELLSSLVPLPARTYATEAYPPNVPVAQRRLEPFGVMVIHIKDDHALPFGDATFDLIINRHEYFDLRELYRILKPGARFITQQVGGENDVRLNELIEGSKPDWHWNLAVETKNLQDSGLAVVDAREAFPELRFHDIGAVVFYLKIVSWQIKDFSVEKYHDQLLNIHKMIERDGYLVVTTHRFLIEVVKPDK